MSIARSHEKPHKILLAMLELGGRSTKFIKYEDIVVKVFQMFPDDFALRGHPEFPDSSDVHKPLYGPLKKRGLVRAANKNFALTPLGLETARRLSGRPTDGKAGLQTGERVGRDVEPEINRMMGSDALKLFVSGNGASILDTDLYGFLGCTVRTPKNDFIGRLTATGNAVLVSKKLKFPDRATSKSLVDTWSFLQEKFKQLIHQRKESKR